MGFVGRNLHLMDASGSKFGFYAPFNSQGHIGIGPLHYHLWESNTHRGDSLWLDAKPSNPLSH